MPGTAITRGRDMHKTHLLLALGRTSEPGDGDAKTRLTLGECCMGHGTRNVFAHTCAFLNPLPFKAEQLAFGIDGIDNKPPLQRTASLCIGDDRRAQSSSGTTLGNCHSQIVRRSDPPEP